VEFQSGRGPVLIPAGMSHLHQIEGVLKRWWMQSHGNQAALPDTYLVVLSTTGWAAGGGQPGCAENYTQLAPSRLTVAAEPQGTDQVRVAFPPRARLPERIVHFLSCFSPYTRSQLLTDICREIEKALQVRSFVTAADLQEELEASESFRAIPIHPQWILEAFMYLAQTGRYEITWNENPELRKASALQQVKNLLKRQRWQSRLFWLITLSALVFSIISILLGDMQNTTIGLLIMLVAQVLNFLSKLLNFWNEKSGLSVTFPWK